jgi:hypothetical protein
MGGKRPDQYQISPREGRSTDYKSNPEDTHGKSGDLGELWDRERQKMAENRGEAQGQPFLPDVPAPSAEANRAARAREQELLDSELDREPGAADTHTDKENPLV